MNDIYPLDAPGIAPFGTDFCEMAQSLGDTIAIVGKGKNKRVERVGNNLEQLAKQALYSDGTFVLNLSAKGGRRVPSRIIGGHIWARVNKGPRPADVMVIGKTLGREELTKDKHLCGPGGQLLKQACAKWEIDAKDWYVTSLLKCVHPDDGEGWLAGWNKDFLPLLQQELRIVRPKYILCLGADAAKALFGKSATLASMDGRVLEYTYPIHRSYEEPEENHTALVMAATHPSYVLVKPELQDKFDFTIQRFGQLTKGERWDRAEPDIDHRTICDVDSLRNLANEIIHCEESYIVAPNGLKHAFIAVDAEWHGEHPQNAGSYVRTIQISWAHKKAACIVLREPGGKECFGGHEAAAIEVLNCILKSTPTRPVRVSGHFLNADLEWLVPLGLDLRDEFEAPADDWTRIVWEGGFDTGLAAHAINETDDFSLKTQALKHTTAPRYDVALEAWKAAYCSEHGLKSKDLEGYGDCPAEVLVPYASYDADVTRRIAYKQMALLDKDKFGNCSWESFWISMRATPSVLEMNRTGLLCDRTRIDLLTDVYLQARERLRTQICDWCRWPDFNINSVQQVREMLFGEELNGKKDKNGEVVRLRPPKARSMGLTPIVSTGKRPIAWAEVVANAEVGKYAPSTGKQTLGILCEEAQAVEKFSKKLDKIVLVDYSKQVGWLRDYRFVSQVLKGFLRPPIVNDETLEPVYDEDDQLTYDAGLAHVMCDDGRVRSHLYQTLETGRWASARPNMQNLSKSREADYERILGDMYLHPLRSIIVASPGHVLVEADFTGAELLGMAVMSGDQDMVDHCLRGQLSEDDPNYYDIHSNIAVRAFRLQCEPTKAALKAINKAALRIVAKAIIFGIAYGRGAKAVALSAKEQGVNVSVDEAQQVADTIFDQYPRLKLLFDECKRRVVNPGWICGAFGRFRRFPEIDPKDNKLLSDLQRQALNAPIQGLVADAMNRAVDHLYYYRSSYNKTELDYRLALQIHDAVVLEVPDVFVAKVIDEVIPECMSKRVSIYPCRLDGTPNGTGPYHLGADTDIYLHWGETVMPDECEVRGIDPKYAHWKTTDKGLVNSNFPRKVWVNNQLIAV